jgi:DNA-binding transcriptional regulator GbsR (MarR family)
MSVINQRNTFIEESGILFETMGMTRMAGRIMGYLMITDKDMASFEELTQVLQASKSSISTNVKACTLVGFIKPITQPGDRKTYYMLSPDISWSDLFRKKAEQLTVLNKMFIKGLELRSNTKDKTSKWLVKAREFNEWVEKEYPSLMDKWDEHVKSREQ